MEINNSFGSLDIAVSGLKAHSKRIELISSNIANARTTNGPDGEPYRRLDAVLKSDSDGVSSVSIDEIVTDESEYQRILDPGNPMANDEGYISMPNVNIPTEMIDLTTASKAYQANVAVMKRFQKMSETTLELLK